MAGAVEIADAYIALYTRMPGVKEDIRTSLGGTESVSRDAGADAGSGFSAGFAGAVGGAMASIATRAMDSVAGSIDSAVSRVDTMANFPKIMANLGYSADDASRSIDTISQGLQGLPTSLDSMAGTVQQLAPLTGGLDEATALSLALNNALLAGGKSTDVQASAMEQYTQMLAVGKVDMAAWRSMVSAMPGQMDQLAKSLLGASAGQTDLYEALQDGTLSFDDFNAAVLDLNENGTGAFASFQEQALSATDGIATSQANLETAVTRGLAGVITELKPVITALQEGLTVAVGVAFDALKGFINWVGENKDWLAPLTIALGVFTAGVWAMNMATTVAAAGGLAKWFLTTKIGTGIQAAFNAVMNANPIMLIVTAIAALVAGLIWFFTQTELGQEIWAGFTEFLGAAFSWLWEDVLQPAIDALGAAFTWLWENAIGPAIDAIGQAFEWLWVNILEPAITAIMIAFGLWAAASEWLWENAIGPAIDAIGQAFTWIYENIIVPIVDAVLAYYQWWADAAVWLWENAIVPALEGIGAAFEWLYENVIRPVFDGIASVFSWIQDNIIQPWTDWLTDAITNVGRTVEEIFGGIGDFIGNAFQSALDLAKTPLNALIDLINGMIEGLNAISVDIPDWVPMVGGQTFSLDIPTIPRLAEGGLVKRTPGGIVANIGEGRYDEAVIPLSPQVLAQLRGGGRPVQIDVHPAPGMSEELIGRAIAGRARHVLGRV